MVDAVAKVRVAEDPERMKLAMLRVTRQDMIFVVISIIWVAVCVAVSAALQDML